MRILTHFDPVALEQELLTQVARVREQAGPFCRVLVIVPTRRLAEHVQRRLVEREGALLGVEVRHFRDLAGEIRRVSGRPSPATASSRILAELLRKCLQDLPPGNGLQGYVERCPGAVKALLAGINDLREAGVDPGRLLALAKQERTGEAPAELYRSYTERLTGSASLLDEAAYMAGTVEILAGNRSFRGRYAGVFLHGVYELVGMHLRLLQAMEPVTVLVPAGSGDGTPACRYAQAYVERFLLQAGGSPEFVTAETRSLPGERLTTLYDEEATPEPVPADRVLLRDFQGAGNEARWAVRQALAAGNPGETCILARNLAPYASALEEAFLELAEEADGATLWTGSLRTPLRREPLVHDALVLLKTVVEDFPRAETVELLSSPRLLWKELLPQGDNDHGSGGLPDGVLADRFSRSAGILHGLATWRQRLPGEARADPDLCRKAERILHLLDALDRRFQEKRDETWSGQAKRFRNLLQILPPSADLEKILKEMELLDELDPGGVPAQKALAWLESTVNDTTVEPGGSENGGIRVLDVMQARGITFRNLVLLGFHAGSFPRIPREDPFLNNRLRRAIAEDAKTPMPGWSETPEEEEHLLLSLMLGSATDSIRISWQRADENGRAVSPSAALREIARLVLGRPDSVEMLRASVAATPVPPLDRLEALAGTTGMLTATESELLAALGSHLITPKGWREGCAGLGLRDRVGAMLESVEQFEPSGDMGWDGRIGPPQEAPERPWSATGLEALGRCPLRFFFQRRLHVEELEPEASPLDILPRERGSAFHALLEQVYRELEAEGRFREEAGAVLLTRAMKLVDRHWDSAFEKLRKQVEEPLLPLWEIREQVWRGEIERFLEIDLPKVASLRPERIEFEEYHEREIDLGEGVRLRAGGKFDRMLVLPGPEEAPVETRFRIGDYKTSGDLKRKTSPTYMLKGRQLQVPIYHLLPETGAEVELLGVGVRFDGAKDEERFPSFAGFENDDVRDGMLETLRVLAGLLEEGVFPLFPDSRNCGHCPYRDGCRRNHPPTLARELASVDTAKYR